MWKCLKCSEDIDDELEVCWNCQANRRGVVESGASGPPEANDDAEFRRFLNKKHGPKNCSGCQSGLNFIGTREFHEGIDWGILGDLGEAFVARTKLEMYACPSCLRVEFFLSDPLV